MAESKLIELSYFDPGKEVRLTVYADTIIMDRKSGNSTITALRFGGYPEVVRAMSDAIYGGITLDAERNGQKLRLTSQPKGYRRQLSHDGSYAIATLMASDDAQTADSPDDNPEEATPQTPQPRKCYIFCPEGDRERLFEELDHKTAAPLIPEFRDYVLDALISKGDLRKLDTVSLKEKLEAWVLDLRPDDTNVVKVLEDGLKSGEISIPGAAQGNTDGFDGVETVTGYLNTFGSTLAQRIREQFTPLFDPATEPLSEEVLAINDYVRQNAGYSLYDAQLAVAEATKRQLQRKGTALIIAECGSGKTKIGSTALGALYGLQAAQGNRATQKSFGLVMCPSHMTRKWVREIGETLPNTYAMVVKSISDFDRLYSLYEMGDRSVYAVFSKEKARDGYMRYPAVTWNRRKRGFVCPDCGEVLQMEISDDGSRYLVNADQFFFQTENRKNHICPHCGSMLWAPVNPSRQIDWVKIGGYGWVYRRQAARHLSRTKNEKVLAQIEEIISHPDGYFPAKGAQRRFPLSTYIKKKYSISVMERTAFPKNDISIPEDTITVTGIPAMVKRSIFATVSGQSADQPLLKCVNLRFTKDGLRAVGSDGVCMVSAKGDEKSTGDIDLLVPSASLLKLARMCEDKTEFRVGSTDQKIVFFREDFVYSARLMNGGYINADQVLNALVNSFTVLTDVLELKMALNAAIAINVAESIKLTFEGNQLKFHCQSAEGDASTSLEIIPLTGTPQGEYWFSPRRLSACLQALNGTVTLGIAQGGMLTLSTNDAFYMQTAMRPPALKVEKPQKSAAKAPRKKAKAKVTEQKAA